MASSSARASLLAHYGPSTVGRTGTRKLTVVPRFGWLSMLIEPPTDAIRERMLPSPWRWKLSLSVLSDEWQKPRPLSETSRVKSFEIESKRMVTRSGGYNEWTGCIPEALSGKTLPLSASWSLDGWEGPELIYLMSWQRSFGCR